MNQFQWLTKIEPKVKKREAKKILRVLLAKHSNGLVAWMRYEAMIKAKRYALDHDLDFPDWAQLELTRSAKELLFEHIKQRMPEQIADSVQLSLRL